MLILELTVSVRSAGWPVSATTMPGPHRNAEDLNSGSHTCAVSTLSIEESPHFLKHFLNKLQFPFVKGKGAGGLA